jgi:DNA (cytosine-5)-methyltransferase 1
MDSRRGRLLGNAVVPAIAEWIGRKIIEVEKYRIQVD